jgi:hypothetical protein
MERGYSIEISAGFIVEHPAPEDVAELCRQFDELLRAQQAERRRIGERRGREQALARNDAAA